jgi:hypothetical protein
MADLQALNPSLHKNLRINKSYEQQLGHGMGAIMILPSEILEVQREYPILLRKHPETGQFLLTALLGFAEHENLFLQEGGKWRASYIPLAMTRGPFSVGINKTESGEQQLVVCVNRDDPRVGQDSGELLFDETGNQSAFMESVRVNLFRLHEGMADTQKVIDAFSNANLIESVNIEIEFKNKEQINFGGAYTINTEKLIQLDVEQVLKLNSEGYLALAYYIAGSLGNIPKLIELKNNALAMQQ